MEGLNSLFKHLYGISLETVEAEPGELWSPDVYKVAGNVLYIASLVKMSLEIVVNLNHQLGGITVDCPFIWISLSVCT